MLQVGYYSSYGDKQFIYFTLTMPANILHLSSFLYS